MGVLRFIIDLVALGVFGMLGLAFIGAITKETKCSTSSDNQSSSEPMRSNTTTRTSPMEGTLIRSNNYVGQKPNSNVRRLK